MARSRNLTPSYLLHSASGRARLKWTDRSGVRQERLLPGKFGSPESLAAKARLELEIASSPTGSLASPDNLTLAELFAAYLDHASQHYRKPDGTPTSELSVIKIAMRAFRELYAEKPVHEFGPLCVKAARQNWANENHTRTECNRRVKIIKRILKWGVSEELVPAAAYQAVATVSGLQKGRTTARELPPVLPVDEAVVDATLPHLGRHVRGLVELQRLTGMRPGEACSIRRCEIDTGGAIWLYKPPHHKGSWRGKDRTIAIGPRAQKLLKEFFTQNLDDYLFSPQRARDDRIAEKSALRQTPRYPSHMKRNALKRKHHPEVSPAEHYSKGSYEVAIDRACDRAFPPPGDLAQRDGETYVAWWGQRKDGKWVEGRLTLAQKAEVRRWQKAHRWSPNQLRHSHATKVRKEFGLEAAGAALGHSKMSATEIYAERDEKLATTVAAMIG